MKKIFNEPKVSCIRFEAKDVITTSGGENPGGGTASKDPQNNVSGGSTGGMVIGGAGEGDTGLVL